MRLVVAAVALLLAGASAVACPVDVTSTSPVTDLKIDARGDGFVQALGTADVLPSGGAILLTDSPDSSSTHALSSAGGARPAAAAALIPLPPAVWSGLVGLGAVGMHAIASKLRRR